MSSGVPRMSRASSVPRLPHPISPTRSLSFAPRTRPADTAVQTAMPAPADRPRNSRRFMSVIAFLRGTDCTRTTPRLRPTQRTHPRPVSLSATGYHLVRRRRRHDAAVVGSGENQRQVGRREDVQRSRRIGSPQHRAISSAKDLPVNPAARVARPQRFRLLGKHLMDEGNRNRAGGDAPSPGPRILHRVAWKSPAHGHAHDAVHRS